MAEINQIDFGDGVNRNIKDVTSRVLLPATVGWTGKNLLDIDKEQQENLGITIVPQNDGTIKVYGTATDTSVLVIKNNVQSALTVGKEYVLSGCPANGSDNSYRLDARASGQNTIIDRGAGVTFTYTQGYASATTFYICIRINNGTNMGTAQEPTIFYPMIRDARITDPTYEPYHKSVEECKADNTVIAPVESGTTASRAYAVGAHFIRNGAFCTAIAAIASGATLTENTNYIEGTIGDYLSEKILLNTDTTLSSSDLTELTLAEHSGNFMNVVLIGYVNSNSAGNRFVINCPAKAIQSAATINLSVVGWINQSNNTFLICIEVKTNKTIISARDYNNNYISNVHIVKVIGYR